MMKVMKTNEYGINALYDRGQKKLTIQENDGSGAFVQHICYGGLRGKFT